MSDLPAIASTVHVVRHGEVENPHSILYGRQPGWKLSERGQEMARTVAEWSKELSLGAIHASPLERAQQTALPISTHHNLAIRTDALVKIILLIPSLVEQQMASPTFTGTVTLPVAGPSD